MVSQKYSTSLFIINYKNYFFDYLCNYLVFILNGGFDPQTPLIYVSAGNDAKLEPPLYKRDGFWRVGEFIAGIYLYIYLAFINEEMLDIFK